MKLALKNCFSFIPMTLLLMACQGSEPASTAMIPAAATTAASEQGVHMSNKLTKQEVRPVLQWQQGTVKYLGMEGGFYGIVTDEGKKLLPMGLPAKYRMDGAKIKVKGEIQKGIMTIQQWGTPFKIAEIELISPGNKQPPSSHADR